MGFQEHTWHHRQLDLQWKLEEFRDSSFKHKLSHLLGEGWRHNL
jgi:hypothetical protein